MRKLFAVMAMILILAGCAAPLRPDQGGATITSNPPGAALTTRWTSGVAPQEWTFGNSGYAAVFGVDVTATWVSGAKSVTTIYLTKGERRNYTIQRPNVPGIDTDVRWAIAAQQNEQVNQQVWAAALHSYNEDKAAAIKSKNAPKQFIDCTSTKVGPTTVNTSCY